VNQKLTNQPVSCARDLRICHHVGSEYITGFPRHILILTLSFRIIKRDRRPFIIMSYISTLNLDPLPEVYNEELLGQELNTWATVPLYFEDTPLIEGFHLGSDSSDSDTLGTPESDLQKLEDDYLYPLLPMLIKNGMPFVQPLETDSTPAIDINNVSATELHISRSSAEPYTIDEMELMSRKRKEAEEKDDLDKTPHDEDKRRRNTMASARFRQRKKLREAALEITAKEMTDKANSLQEKVNTLEKEAKWLRSLLVEKGDTTTLEVDEER
jgi:Basic region leucine zipper